MSDHHIRWMTCRDMPEVLDIESASFEFPWSEDDFIHALRSRNTIGMVAERGDRVAGFMVYDLHKTGIHVQDFAVAPDCRRLGVGSQMVAKLTAKLSPTRRSTITLEVRDVNLPAQLFFQACGFRAIGIIHGHYDESDDDAYQMIYRYGQHPRKAQFLEQETTA